MADTASERLDNDEKDALVRYLDEFFPLGELGSPTHIPAPLEVTDAFRAGFRSGRALKDAKIEAAWREGYEFAHNEAFSPS